MSAWRWVLVGLSTVCVALIALAFSAIFSAPARQKSGPTSVVPPRLLMDLALTGSQVAAYPTAEARKTWSTASGQLQAADPLHKAVREAGDHLADSAANAQVLQDRFAATMLEVSKLLDEGLAQAVKANQLNSYIRLRVLLKTQIEASTYANRIYRFTLTNDPLRGAALAADESKLRQFIPIYTRMTRNASEKDMVDKIGRLLESAFNDARDIVQLTNTRQDAWQGYAKTLAPLAGGSSPLGVSLGTNRLRNLGWFILALVVIGAALILLSIRILKGDYFEPLKEISAVSEAAVTGDLSRDLQPVAHPELNRLRSAMNRMLNVLRRSNQLIYQLATLVESAGDAIIGITRDGTILTWNAGAKKIYGYEVQEVRGKSIEVLLAPEKVTEWQSILARFQAGESVPPVETVHRRKNGDLASISLHFSPIRDSQTHIIGISLLCRDQTEYRHLEQERDRLQGLSHSLMSGPHS